MLRIMIITLGTAIGLGMTGCETLGPQPTSPEQKRYVAIDTIPTGADIYAVDPQSGSLGVKIGTTPTIITAGIAHRRWSSGRPSTTPTLWGHGLSWRRQEGSRDVIINLAAVKDGYATAYVSRHIWTIRQGEFPNNTTITVPLSSLRRDPPSVPAPQQQQQQQQQQTVIVPDRDRPDASTVGKLIVTSTVEGADIYVDGLFVGNAPANLTLTSGVHIIEVKRTGYRPFKRELRVFANSETTLRAELERDE